MSIDSLAKATGMSTNYLATRLRGERLLNLRDFEAISNAFEIDPQEMLARGEVEPARTYRMRMVPLYGVTFSQKLGMEIFRTEDAVPPVRDLTIRIAGEPIEDSSDDDGVVLPEGLIVSGVSDDVDPHTLDLRQGDYELATTKDKSGIKEQSHPNYEDQTQETEEKTN